MTTGSAILSYPERLTTFSGFWNENQATARQLAALGHVYDRPPLEALEEGSRCTSCSKFMRRDLSVKALEGSICAIRGGYGDGFANFNFHYPSCIRLQVKIPLGPQALRPGLQCQYRFHDMRNRFEKEAAVIRRDMPPQQTLQTSGLFNLPTEIRLEIYAMILPKLDKVCEIVPLNRDSARVVTRGGYEKAARWDLTKANILRTCQTVCNEALDLLYTRCTFSFASSKVMYLFLRHIGANGRKLVMSVDIHCGQREDAIAFALLASCEQLRAITIRLGRPRILFPRSPIWCVDGMACLLSLSGMEDVSFGDCGTEQHRSVHMSDDKPDAAILRKELMRSKDGPSNIKWVDGYPDI